jgi:hypothetical protein
VGRAEETTMDETRWAFPAPDGLLMPGTALFVYETGVRIGLGKVVSNTDDAMLVDIEFTEPPRLGCLTYATVADAAGLGDAP